MGNTEDERTVIQPLDRDALKRDFDQAEPFRHFVISNFLSPDFAREVAAAVPTFEQAAEQGFGFDFVQERRKIQISDREKFPESIGRLSDALASPQFISDLEFITGIPNLQSDSGLAGGGIHVTADTGRLDVHVDFNYNEEHQCHRRLNVLVYLNPEWDEAWGGAVELWDRDVKNCLQRVPPLLNTCVLFETSHISFHGVEPVHTPENITRNSFAAYYYTKEAPANWDGKTHGTIFRTRPDEKFRRFVLVPAEKFKRKGLESLRTLKRSLRRQG